MKKAILFFVLFVVWQVANAQTIGVRSFRALPTDMTASSREWETVNVHLGERTQVRITMEKDESLVADTLTGETAQERNDTIDKTRFFVLANGSYSMAPQLSYGITFGMVHRLGWYMNVNTNFKARKSAWYNCSGDGWIEDLTNYSYMGAQSTSRFSATAGLVCRLWRPVYLYLGGGYGWRDLYWLVCLGNYSSYYWAKNVDYSYAGGTADAGLMFRFNKVGVSLGAQTIGGTYWEANVGIGIVF